MKLRAILIQETQLARRRIYESNPAKNSTIPKEGIQLAKGEPETEQSSGGELRDKKGGKISEWPEDLRIQQWPKGF
jgi:hypothetical protein